MFVPYQVNQRAPGSGKIDQVELLIATSHPGNWKLLQSAKANVQGFSYLAPEDGYYWFALRHRDARGQLLGPAEPPAQLHLVIDTQPPQLTLDTTYGNQAELIVRYEARDANLDASSLLLEVSSDGDQWTPLSLPTPDVQQSDRVLGRARWSLPPDVQSIEVRAAVADLAGNREQAHRQAPLQGPAFQTPDRTPDRASADPGPRFSPSRDPFRFDPPEPAQDWPLSNQLPGGSEPDGGTQSGGLASGNLTAPPIRNPYATTAQSRSQPRTAATLAADQQQWASADARAADDLTTTPMLVNSRTFDIDYDLQSVGPWGVAKVELWGTDDGGRTWRSFGTDPDNRSPIRAKVPAAGSYGFRILVDGANGSVAMPPRNGEAPEMLVTVDLTPPQARISSTRLGEGNLRDHLQISWTAHDDNLLERPIGLFYSSSPGGPWSTLATGLENTGQYTWRLERHLPGLFYLRLEVRDTAGNVAHFDSPDPIHLPRPQPQGHLRNVRPVN